MSKYVKRTIDVTAGGTLEGVIVGRRRLKIVKTLHFIKKVGI